MNDRTLLSAGLIGTVIAALCCFTPVLVVLAGVVGLSAIVGHLDYVLLPALVFFIGLAVYAMRRRPIHARATGQAKK
ncbi:mercury resistance system transport protein MerF [Ferrovibrio xuzhouensis]|uniref:Mercury resistance system transport protein MerF n=1 Tax=Ferrovibrio xuzhouensis TaxID=1576914 RepID=A0ABV7VJY1_9PROT